MNIQMKDFSTHLKLVIYFLLWINNLVTLTALSEIRQWFKKIKWPLLVRLRLKHFLLNICDLQCNHHHRDKTETLKCYGILLVPSVYFNSSFDVIRLLPSLFDWEGSQRNWTWRWYVWIFRIKNVTHQSHLLQFWIKDWFWIIINVVEDTALSCGSVVGCCIVAILSPIPASPATSQDAVVQGCAVTLNLPGLRSTCATLALGLMVPEGTG